MSKILLSRTSLRHWFVDIQATRTLVHKARSFKQIGPFTAGNGMAEPEMLAEVISAVEFLRRVAFSKFVRLLQVTNSCVPILVGSAPWGDTAAQDTCAKILPGASELVTTVAANVGHAGMVSRSKEGSFITT